MRTILNYHNLVVNLIPLFVIFTDRLMAQPHDSLRISIGTNITTSTQNFQPLWLVSNRYGVIQDKGADASTNILLRNSNNFFFKRGGLSDSVQISYGINLINNNNLKDFFFSEAFSKIRYKGFEARFGRYIANTGEMDSELSTGSLGISKNALPIPRLSLAIPNYVSFPLTKGLLEVKGVFSHGWMGSNQSLRDAFLHEKSLYGRIGKKKLKVFGGIQHFAVWGGHRDDFRLDRSFSGFLDVLLVKEANDGSLDTSIYPNKRANRAGDQRGLIEYGASWSNEKYDLKLYNQTPFESGTGIDIRNIDRLVGATLMFKNENVKIRKVVLEFMYTKQMESYGKESQSYYNNGVYRTGWEYESRIIGTPLFINHHRGSKFLSVGKPDWESDRYNLPGNLNVLNNRIVGLHLGTTYRLSHNVMAKTLVTATVNYGSRGDFVFVPAKNQLYTLQELQAKLSKNIGLNLSLAFDSGDFYTNLGGMLGIKYYLGESRSDQK